MSALYCETELPAFDQDICHNEPSRIIAVAYLRTDHGISNFENAGQWQSAIDAGKVVVIKSVSGEEAEQSPKKIDGFGREKSRTTALAQTVNYEHNFSGSPAQTNFYNALNYASDRYFAYYTAGKKLFVVSDATVDVNARRSIPKTLDDIIKWMVTVEWDSQVMPVEMVGPESIFE